MGEALAALQKIYFSCELNLDDMLAACKSPDERNQVMAKYVAARQNYWQCINHAFHEDDPALKALVARATQSTADLKAIDTQLGDIAKVIGILTNAVDIGAQIAAKVIAV